MMEEMIRNVELCLKKKLSEQQRLLAEYLIKHGYDSRKTAEEIKSMEYGYWNVSTNTNNPLMPIQVK